MVHSMGRELRMVPPTWEHPKTDKGHFIPLHSRGPGRGRMPSWPESERTHFQMYETTSEGTPISPALPTGEELARWLADHGASAFGTMTATYEQWLAVIRGAYAPSAVLLLDREALDVGVLAGKIVSGVAFGASGKKFG